MRFHRALAAISVLGQLSRVLASPILDTDDAQKPLLQAAGDAKFTLYEQSEDICDAGSRQWTGWVNVSDEKKLFFWFFESRDKPTEDPIVVWLNGGPGGSSLMGLFTEIGPCLTNEGNNDTFRNEHSWTNFANMLFIDQPAGVGFSSINNGTAGGPNTIKEAVVDFDKFLSVFFTEVFPQFSHLSFHVAGESFAGTYLPAFVSYISRRQQLGVPDVSQVPIQSITLVDAVIDVVGSGALGSYDHMCRFDEHGKNKIPHGYNATVCRAIEKAVPECERLNRHCIETYDREICMAAAAYCQEHIEKYLEVGVGAHNPYDDRYMCNGTTPLCGIDTYFGRYLNQPKVQEALGFGLHREWNYTPINYEMNDRWHESRDMYMPTTRELTWILDETETKVLVMNGNNDIIVNTEGQKRVYDNQPWNHQAKYRLEKFADWQWPDEKRNMNRGGEFKVVDKLGFTSIDEAGHTSPGDQKVVAAFIMECWLRDGGREACPFGFGTKEILK
ncbi:Alpha/Beta hydrolase protein [Pseudomassariella vexata]|uniref:Alpha/Beta hydrolase protein n=1 Tax=Pseudomassariella vexata TaxID=1141098 RepID=A0A1Y2E554_9PEZI|nr:Alpha/Beta hydrolase protein [Pseudomassariella vexata]ORY66577.1 Alpha/Beta hydrolase protein [Pseudomassariella vexata]